MKYEKVSNSDSAKLHFKFCVLTILKCRFKSMSLPHTRTPTAHVWLPNPTLAFYLSVHLSDFKRLKEKKRERKTSTRGSFRQSLLSSSESFCNTSAWLISFPQRAKD